MRYPLDDHLFSSVGSMDSSGNKVATVRYFPFGGTRFQEGDLAFDKKFTGQRLDQTGPYYYNARYYDAMIGRFINPDTIVPNPANPQSLNRYSYCLNNPLRYVDPSGRWYVPSVDQIYSYVADNLTSPYLTEQGKVTASQIALESPPAAAPAPPVSTTGPVFTTATLPPVPFSSTPISNTVSINSYFIQLTSPVLGPEDNRGSVHFTVNSTISSSGVSVNVGGFVWDHPQTEGVGISPRATLIVGGGGYPTTGMWNYLIGPEMNSLPPYYGSFQIRVNPSLPTPRSAVLFIDLDPFDWSNAAPNEGYRGGFVNPVGFNVDLVSGEVYTRYNFLKGEAALTLLQGWPDLLGID